MIFLKSIFIVLTSLLFICKGWSQEKEPLDKQILIVTGYSPSSVLFLGKTPNTSTSIIKLEFRKKTKRSFLKNPLYYQFGIIPFIEYDYPKRDERGRKDIVKGFGLSPIGLGIHNSISKKISYSLYFYGGFILVDKIFPTDRGRKLNYTFSLSSDIVFSATDLISFSLGYKFHHISNAQTGTENPGIDSNFITFSLIISK